MTLVKEWWPIVIVKEWLLLRPILSGEVLKWIVKLAAILIVELLTSSTVLSIVELQAVGLTSMVCCDNDICVYMFLVVERGFIGNKFVMQSFKGRGGVSSTDRCRDLLIF